ncbi:MAG: hypothetical protein PHI97_13760 [Desulfobulbus sp.]|nr:hypothetical protein [Desulfobulbus sp.]
MYSSKRFQIWYNSNPEDKLSQAKLLQEYIQHKQMVDTSLHKELELLRNGCHALGTQMTTMDLGRLCSLCAARPGGGCCSAYMADNTDSIQILINLLLGKEIYQREPADHDCCFLGPSGCLFMAKPIFCLNYNCSHIATGSGSTELALLEQRAATVLSQQTRIESILLERLRHCSE